MKNPRITLAMLLLVYSFNFLDRQILSILAQPVQRDLGLDDGQMGMLGGLAFAALYSTLAIPLALIADRTSRTWSSRSALPYGALSPRYAAPRRTSPRCFCTGWASG